MKKKEYLCGPIEEFINEKRNVSYDNLIFGMSHSLGGCEEWRFPGNTYKFSIPSADLNYHLLVLKALIPNYDMSRVKNIYFELPYYIFNYDIKKATNIYPMRTNYYEYVEMLQKNDVVNPKVSISKYTSILESIKRPYRYLQSAKTKRLPHIWNVEEIEEIKRSNFHVWKTMHSDTISEMAKVWKEIARSCVELQSSNPGLKINVIVFPFCSYFSEEFSSDIDRMKVVFYNNVTEFVVIDRFDTFAEYPEYFSDYCHLNELGALQFTKLLACLNKI